MKIIEGNPGRQRLPEDEPRPAKPLACPEPPAFLDERASDEWRRIAPDLWRLGLLTDLDLAALVGYATSFSLWQRCAIEAATVGPERRERFERMARQALLDMLRFGMEFGLTPASRAKLSTPPDDARPDPLKVLLG